MSELLPWHHHEWRRLVARGARLPHALLLAGPEGIGKEAFAGCLVAALLCQAPDRDGAPCGRCQGCRLLRAGGHPDHVRVEPVETGKPIKVDQVRAVSAFLNYTSQFGGYKIALIVAAERMNINAANSLLKTLEEPPPASLLLLVSSQPAKLPATVRSRCQILNLRIPDPERVMPWLAPRVGDAEPALLLRLAAGAPLNALAQARDGRLARRRELFRGYLDAVQGQADPVGVAEAWAKGNLAEHLRWLIAWHMDMIRLKMGTDPPGLLNRDLQETLRRLAERLPAQVLFQRLDQVIRMHELCGTQVNSQLMLEVFLGECASD
jgi:DNA polymerase-3 subunit delta'